MLLIDPSGLSQRIKNGKSQHLGFSLTSFFLVLRSLPPEIRIAAWYTSYVIFITLGNWCGVVPQLAEMGFVPLLHIQHSSS